jgi:hypothetical protein
MGEGGAVAVGELPKRLGPGAPLEVEVELHLREGTQVSHLPMVARWVVTVSPRLAMDGAVHLR